MSTSSEDTGSRTELTEELAAAREKIDQLQTALTSRVIIEQAKGVLAERLSIDVDAAFDILRYAARTSRLKLHDVAGRVVSESETPAPVIVAVARASSARAAWMRELGEAQRARTDQLKQALREQHERMGNPKPVD